MHFGSMGGEIVNPWLGLAVLSAVAGIAAAFVFRGRMAIAAGAAVPWFGLLGVLLYYEFFVPYDGGGASMWPIAQLVGGTFAAVVGGVTAAIVRRLRRKP